MSKLLVVEDHAMVREGMVQALRWLPGIARVEEAGDAEAALGMLARTRFDLILLDLILPRMNGFTLLTLLRRRSPDSQVIVVTGMTDAETMDRSLRLGAAGFVAKSSSGTILVQAVREVLQGGIFVPSRSPGQPATTRKTCANAWRSSPGTARLTDAQERVLDLLTQGKTNRDIAEQLGLTEGTVKVHLTAIYRALNVANRAQALLAAARRARAM